MKKMMLIAFCFFFVLFSKTVFCDSEKVIATQPTPGSPDIIIETKGLDTNQGMWGGHKPWKLIVKVKSCETNSYEIHAQTFEPKNKTAHFHGHIDYKDSSSTFMMPMILKDGTGYFLFERTAEYEGGGDSRVKLFRYIKNGDCYLVKTLEIDFKGSADEVYLSRDQKRMVYIYGINGVSGRVYSTETLEPVATISGSHFLENVRNNQSIYNSIAAAIYEEG